MRTILSSTDPIIFPNLGIEVDPGKGFTIGNFTIAWYGVIIALGTLLAAIYLLRRCGKFGLTQDELLNILIIGLPSAIVGARLYYVLFEWDVFFGPNSNWYDWLNIRDGGLAIYGGILGAVIAIVLYLGLSKKRRRTLLPILDMAAIALPIGQAFGRWGNFFNREAFGNYTDNFLAMRISSSHSPSDLDQATKDLLLEKATEGGYSGFIQVHPTFLYESLWCGVGFVLLHFASKKRKFDGEMMLLYIAWYGLGRAFIEGLRTDSLYIGPFRVSQWLAGISCVAALAVFVFLRFVRKPDTKNLLVNRMAAEVAESVAVIGEAEDEEVCTDCEEVTEDSEKETETEEEEA